MDDAKKELQDLKADLRRWSDEADMILALEDQGLSVRARRLLRALAEVKL